MANENSRVSRGWCLIDGAKDFIVIFVQNGLQAVSANLDGAEQYSVRWYSPKVGGSLQFGQIRTVSPGRRKFLGRAPTSGRAADDWVILLRRLSVSRPDT